MTDPCCPVSDSGSDWFRSPAFMQLASSAGLGVVLSSLDGRIERTNPALRGMVGYSDAELSGRMISEFFSSDVGAVVRLMCHQLSTSGAPWWRTTLQLRNKDGEPLHVEWTMSVLHDGARRPRWLVTTLNDITELQLVQQRLSYQTLHDLRTGLPNRQYFLSHLERVVAAAAPDAVVTLLHLDLDDFSVINEGLGPSHGDQILDLVARCLEVAVGDQEAMVARIGGDEYAVLLQPTERAPDVGLLAAVINSRLTGASVPEGAGGILSASIGAVQQRAGTASPPELMRAAGAAVRRARASGARWALFDARGDPDERAELRLAARIAEALGAGELRVEYQPIVALDTGKLVGLEAVLTWWHPELGPLPHDRCVQLAERTGARHSVVPHLLAVAAEQVWSWQQDADEKLLPTVVKIGCTQAQDTELVSRITAQLHGSNLSADALELSVPASTLGVPAAETNLRLLADLGVRTAVHDFSGDIRELARLVGLGVASVWICPAMTRQAGEGSADLVDQALRALVPLLRRAGITVTACRVDSRALADWWRDAGAHHAVGALFGAPSPSHRAERLLKAAVAPRGT